MDTNLFISLFSKENKIPIQVISTNKKEHIIIIQYTKMCILEHKLSYNIYSL